MNLTKQVNNKIFFSKKTKKLIITLIFAILLNFFLFSMPVLASTIDGIKLRLAIISEETTNVDENAYELDKVLPNNINVISTSIHTVTAYNSEPGQTDDTPCITANGFNLCEHGIEDSVAANFLRFGTKVRIPELYGDKVFTVRDRMNKRYTSRMDIWMLEKSDAIKFGAQRVSIEVLE